MKDFINLEEKEIASSGRFKYLKSIFQSSEDIQQDVTHRIKCGWQKWRAATKILCDRYMPLKVKV